MDCCPAPVLRLAAIFPFAGCRNARLVLTCEAPAVFGGIARRERRRNPPPEFPVELPPPVLPFEVSRAAPPATQAQLSNWSCRPSVPVELPPLFPVEKFAVELPPPVLPPPELPVELPPLFPVEEFPVELPTLFPVEEFPVELPPPVLPFESPALLPCDTSTIVKLELPSERPVELPPLFPVEKFAVELPPPVLHRRPSFPWSFHHYSPWRSFLWSCLRCSPWRSFPWSFRRRYYRRCFRRLRTNVPLDRLPHGTCRSHKHLPCIASPKKSRRMIHSIPHRTPGGPLDRNRHLSCTLRRLTSLQMIAATNCLPGTRDYSLCDEGLLACDEDLPDEPALPVLPPLLPPPPHERPAGQAPPMGLVDLTSTCRASRRLRSPDA